MSAFRFRLERLLRVRTIEEELAREAWLEAEAHARTAEADCEAKRAGAAAALLALREHQAEPSIAPSRVLVEQLHLETQRRTHARAALHARTRATEAARFLETWRACDAAKQGLERLEEKARAAHRAEANLKETLTLDEVASMRAARAARIAALAASGARGVASDREPRRAGSQDHRTRSRS